MIGGMPFRSVALRLIFFGLTVTAAADAGSQNVSTPLRLQATVLGTGEPVVLIGGGLLGADGWGGVPALLAKTHRVINAQSIAVQYGLENRSLPAGYSLHTEVAALRASLDSMRVDIADFIGMSHGGVTALVFALENPRRVRTLTLIEPPAFWVLPNHGYDDPGAREMQELVGALRSGTITEAHVEHFRCVLGDCVNGRSPRQSPQWSQWVKYRNSLRGLYTIGDYQDDASRLRGIIMPTLVVHGSATVAFHRAINAALVKLLPRAEALELAGGHNSPAADPDYFIAAWQKFAVRPM
jgi:pimeloyl-ACP methyl ester carboxylesterase